MKEVILRDEEPPDDTVVVFNTGTGFKYIETMAPSWDAAAPDR